MREERTEVLVVGAGPVGLMNALVLAQSGLQTIIIDREARTTARSYACALHSRTLKLLDGFGLAKPLLAAGRRIDKVAFYDGAERRAEVKLGASSESFPYILILPQSVLEKTLEDHLRAKFGVSVQWNHRLSQIQPSVDCAEATVEELAWSQTGYIVPHSELTVRRQIPIRAQVVVGADGHASTVRQRCRIEFEQFGSPYHFAAYEFEPRKQTPDELRIVLDGKSVNVLWPLAENRLRWTFQVTHGYTDWPEKERQGGRVAAKGSDEKIRAFVEKVAEERAPWFDAGVKEIAWCTRVSFERRLARHFGVGQCWLTGDAAHQTGPAGAQSMNAGLLEAETLAPAIQSFINENGKRELLNQYHTSHHSEWRTLLGIGGQVKATCESTPWVEQNVQRIIPALPGLGADLAALAKQLHIDIGS